MRPTPLLVLALLLAATLPSCADAPRTGATPPNVL